MERKISVKSLHLLLVISIGLIGLGIGSTYAVFTAKAEIDSPIVLNSNLSHDSEVIETIEIEVPAGETVSSTLNISNTSGGKLNYIVWYLNEGVSIMTGTSSGSPQGSLENGGSTTVVVDIMNTSDTDTTVILGIVSGSEIVLSKGMTPISSSSFTMSSQISYDNSKTRVNCNDVTCMLDLLYTYTDIGTTNKVNLEVGDYVSYTPTVTSYPIDTTYTGYTSSQTIYPSELNLWRVLNINSDGTIDLISEYVSSTDVYFKGFAGYKNFVGYLNVLASQYETEGITKGSRYFGFNGQTEYITNTSMFTTTPPFGCSTDGTKGNCSNTTYPKDPDDYEVYGGGDTLYTTDYDRVATVLGTRVANKVETTTATAYWMASRFHYYSSASYYDWSGRYVNMSGNGDYNILYYYNSGILRDNANYYALRPIVTLKSGLHYEGAGTEGEPRRIIA